MFLRPRALNQQKMLLASPDISYISIAVEPLITKRWVQGHFPWIFSLIPHAMFRNVCCSARTHTGSSALGAQHISARLSTFRLKPVKALTGRLRLANPGRIFWICRIVDFRGFVLCGECCTCTGWVRNGQDVTILYQAKAEQIWTESIVCSLGWQMPWRHQVQLALQVTDLCQISETTCGRVADRPTPAYVGSLRICCFTILKFDKMSLSHLIYEGLSVSGIDIRADPKASSTQAYSSKSCLIKENLRLYLRNP